MGDQLVTEVLESWESLAFANGVSIQALRPFADKAVNRLREYGMDDDDIYDALVA